METGIDKRRTIRIRRSALLDSKVEAIDRPSIKIAETLDEYSGAFALVHKEYADLGYVQPGSCGGLHYNIHSLLPKTCVFVFKAYLSVISTLSMIPDSPVFGLPMDALYKGELDELRERGRKVVEIGALATDKSRRWKNIMMFIVKAMFHYAVYTKVNDICIMVNPKHVRFYRTIFLFDDFGPERHYPGVGAPAVALRINFDNVSDTLKQAYGMNDFETDLYSFFIKMHHIPKECAIPEYEVEKNRPVDQDAARFFFKNKPELLKGLSPEQWAEIDRLYHEALYVPGSPFGGCVGSGLVN